MIYQKDKCENIMCEKWRKYDTALNSNKPQHRRIHEHSTPLTPPDKNQRMCIMQKKVAQQQGSRIFPFARAPAPEVKKFHCPGPGRGSPSQPQGPRAKPTQTPLKPVGGTQPWTPFTPPPRWVWCQMSKKDNDNQKWPLSWLNFQDNATAS